MLNERQRWYTRLLMAGFGGVFALMCGVWTMGAFAGASLSASPASPEQNGTVTLVGAGFRPGETVSIWITYPDFTVLGVAEIVTNGEGSFHFPYLPDFLSAAVTPTGKYTYTAHGQTSGHEVYASITVDIHQASHDPAGVTLTVEPKAASQGRAFVFRGRGFFSQEEVTLSLRYPDNTVADLGRLTSGPGGVITYELSVRGAPVGAYTLTARGLLSGGIGLAEFEVQIVTLSRPDGQARLRITSDPDPQQRYAQFAGSGFQPGEIVTIWVTLPDYATLWVGDAQVDDDGAFSTVLYVREPEPMGTRTYTAYGNTSHLLASSQ